MSDSPAPAQPADRPAGHHPRSGLARLAVGAVGIVFGDIGTSPIYAFRETFSGHHDLSNGQTEILGVLSLIFWSMMIVVTIKYVTIIMRADNKGEGGSLALLALINRKADTGKRRWSAGIVLLGVFACALFYGDSMITPAISVLSAVEGLTTVESHFGPYVVPVAIFILVGLFAIQSTGTARVGAFFGPIMILYFVTISVLGLTHIAGSPWIILETVNPLNAVQFFLIDGWSAFLALGSVVLAVTGAEALYADMGHFGRKPIGVSWLFFVMPALMLNYMGQGAMVLSMDPAAGDEVLRNPFFFLAPEAMRLPLVILATFATVIASQAVISGAFSVTQQAMHLGFIPRLRIQHTSEAAMGQIYIPVVNWALMIMVILLVLFFQNSSNLAAAYGIAVTGAMFIDTCLLTVVLLSLWSWRPWLAIPVLAVFFLVDIAYFAANLTKVPDGGWFPLLVGLFAFTLLTTWAKGRQLMIKRMNEAAMPATIFIKSAASSATRVPGTAVFMTTAADGVPHALLHNLKHNKVLHERVLLLTVKIEDVPYVEEEKTFHLDELGQGFYRLIIRYGFMQETNVPAALARVDSCGPQFRMIDTSFFLARQTLIASPQRPGMALWREKLFAWMLRNAESAMEFFNLPPNRVVELGSQVEIESQLSVGPIIVTALFGDGDNGWLQELRRVHYPPERNRVPAHLTLFRHLPPGVESELADRLRAATAAPPPRAAIAGIMDLGEGTALRVDSEDLLAIREDLAEALHGLLIPQDRAPWRPHVTIQNKVAPRDARRLQHQLRATFEPRPLAIRALASWRYLGGPWEPIRTHVFRK